MSKLNFSKGKFGKFLSSKGFYVAVAVCLIGAGAATWLAVDKTITGIENNNNQLIESENEWKDYPELEQERPAAEVERKQSGVEMPASPTEPPPQLSEGSASSSSLEPVSEPIEQSEPPIVSVQSPSLAYVLPIKSDIINQYSAGELVKNVTLGDWRTHDGIDIAADKGTDVLASADGVVSSVKSDALWGTVITIDHADGRQTVYCGLDKVTPVKEGDAVMTRQVIGTLDGVPCEIGDANHLHFAMKQDGQWVNPLETMMEKTA